MRSVRHEARWSPRRSLQHIAVLASPDKMRELMAEFVHVAAHGPGPWTCVAGYSSHELAPISAVL